MRAFLFLAALCLALAPLAAAGPGASVQTLGTSSGCRSYGDSQYGGNTTPDGGYQYQSYWYEHKCLDNQTVASVSAQDNNGQVAGANVGNEHDNSSSYAYGSRQSWGDQYSSTYQDSYHSYADHWARGTSVSTRAGDVSAGYGCDSRYSDLRGYSQWSNSGSSNSGSSNHQGNGRSACGEDVSSSLLGTPASAGVVNYGCSSSQQNYSSYWQDQNGYRSFRDGQRDDRCFTGPAASAEGQSLGAGLGSGCESRSWSSSSQMWTGNETQSHSDRATWSSCYSGLVAQGPDGSSFFLGERDTSNSYCSDGNCSDGSSRLLVVEFAWEHNPLQPYPIIIAAPLP